jgi:hypothetical protein
LSMVSLDSTSSVIVLPVSCATWSVPVWMRRVKGCIYGLDEDLLEYVSILEYGNEGGRWGTTYLHLGEFSGQYTVLSSLGIQCAIFRWG